MSLTEEGPAHLRLGQLRDHLTRISAGVHEDRIARHLTQDQLDRIDSSCGPARTGESVEVRLAVVGEHPYASRLVDVLLGDDGRLAGPGRPAAGTVLAIRLATGETAASATADFHGAAEVARLRASMLLDVSERAQAAGVEAGLTAQSRRPDGADADWSDVLEWCRELWSRSQDVALREAIEEVKALRNAARRGRRLLGREDVPISLETLHTASIGYLTLSDIRQRSFWSPEDDEPEIAGAGPGDDGLAPDRPISRPVLERTVRLIRRVTVHRSGGARAGVSGLRLILLPPLDGARRARERHLARDELRHCDGLVVAVSAEHPEPPSAIALMQEALGERGDTPVMAIAIGESPATRRGDPVIAQRSGDSGPARESSAERPAVLRGRIRAALPQVDENSVFVLGADSSAQAPRDAVFGLAAQSELRRQQSGLRKQLDVAERTVRDVAQELREIDRADESARPEGPMVRHELTQLANHLLRAAKEARRGICDVDARPPDGLSARDSVLFEASRIVWDWPLWTDLRSVADGLYLAPASVTHGMASRTSELRGLFDMAARDIVVSAHRIAESMTGDWIDRINATAPVAPPEFDELLSAAERSLSAHGKAGELQMIDRAARLDWLRPSDDTFVSEDLPLHLSRADSFPLAADRPLPWSPERPRVAHQVDVVRIKRELVNAVARVGVEVLHDRLRRWGDTAAKELEHVREGLPAGNAVNAFLDAALGGPPERRPADVAADLLALLNQENP